MYVYVHVDVDVSVYVYVNLNVDVDVDVGVSVDVDVDADVCPVLSCPVLSRLVSSRLVLSCLVLSCVTLVACFVFLCWLSRVSGVVSLCVSVVCLLHCLLSPGSWLVSRLLCSRALVFVGCLGCLCCLGFCPLISFVPLFDLFLCHVASVFLCLSLCQVVYLLVRVSWFVFRGSWVPCFFVSLWGRMSFVSLCLRAARRPMTIRYRRGLAHRPYQLEVEHCQLRDSFSTL